MGRVCSHDCWWRQEHQPRPPSVLPDQSDLVAGSIPDAHEQAAKIYRPLQIWETRLIELHPGQPKDRITCRLLTADIIDSEGFGVRELNGIVYYDALSYSWGYPEMTYLLLVNNYTFLVTEVLATALMHLRDTTEPLYLWIDAFCINQQDLEEKAAQVKNMYRIYQKSNRVLAWLGQEDPWSFLAFRLLDEARQMEGVQWQEDYSELSEYSSQPRYPDVIRTEESSDGIYHSPQCLDPLMKAHNALLNIFNRPWFERTWVRQEVYASNQLIVQCGTLRTTKEKLFLDWKSSREKIEKNCLRLCETCLQEEDYLVKLNNLAQGPSRFNENNDTAGDVLTSTLSDGTGFGASDDRDRVYGVLGMIRGETGMESIRNFPIDYNKSTSEVYQDVVRFCIQSDHSGDFPRKAQYVIRDLALRILTKFEVRPDRAVDMPSWAIDWREPNRVVRSALGVLVENSESSSFRYRFPEEVLHNLATIEANREDKRVSSDTHTELGKLRLKGYRFGTLHGMTLNASQRQISLPPQSYHWQAIEPLLASGFYTLTKVKLMIEEPIDREAATEIIPLAIVPGLSADGDLVVFLQGGSDIPFLLRQVGEGCYNLLGVAWMYYGTMNIGKEPRYSVDNYWQTLIDGGTQDFCLV